MFKSKLKVYSLDKIVFACLVFVLTLCGRFFKSNFIVLSIIMAEVRVVLPGGDYTISAC